MLPPVSLPIEKPTSPAAVAAPGPGARSRRAFFEQPRVHRLAAEPDVVERQRAQAQLGDEHRAGLVQTAHDGGVGGRHAIPERLRAVGRRDACGVEQIFDADTECRAAARGTCRRRSPRRPASPARARASFVSVMTQRSFGSNCSIRAQIDAGQALGCELPSARSSATAASPARRRCRHRWPATDARRPCCARTHRATGPALAPASNGFQRVAGATSGSSATLRGPTRRSSSGAIDRRQLAAAISRSAAVIVTCASFSASAKVDADTGGPDAGAGAERRRRARRRSRRRSGGAPADRRGTRAAAPRTAEWCGNEELSARVHRGLRDGSSRPPRGCIACCGSHPVTRLARRSTGTCGGIRFEPDTQPCLAESRSRRTIGAGCHGRRAEPARCGRRARSRSRVRCRRRAAETPLSGARVRCGHAAWRRSG